jgi:hypothetical protein
MPVAQVHLKNAAGVAQVDMLVPVVLQVLMLLPVVAQAAAAHI